MAIRPLVFGVLMREKGRSLRVRSEGNRGYILEDTRVGQTKRTRRHRSLESALRDLARSWRHRLH